VLAKTVERIVRVDAAMHPTEVLRATVAAASSLFEPLPLVL